MSSILALLCFSILLWWDFIKTLKRQFAPVAYYLHLERPKYSSIRKQHHMKELYSMCGQHGLWIQSFKVLRFGVVQFSSVHFSRSFVSDSLQPHESQHARPPCPSPTPGVYSNSCPLSQWCHPAISSSVVPFSSCPQSIPESDSFPMSQIFAWGGQSTGV